MKQGKYSVCGSVFQEEEVVIRLREWIMEGALYLSKIENRNHPPEK